MQEAKISYEAKQFTLKVKKAMPFQKKIASDLVDTPQKQPAITGHVHFP